jgi:hypothetical protein
LWTFPSWHIIGPGKKIMHKKNKKIIISLLIIILSFVFSGKVSATTLTLSTPKEQVDQQEQFLVNVSLSPDKDEDVNAFDLSISYSPNLTFVGQKDGLSITGLWIEKPNAKGNLVDLSGIIPGGFKGLFDPMSADPINNQKPGILTQLIFIGNSAGQAVINFNKQDVLANDSLGTTLPVSGNSLALNVSNKVVPFIIDMNDTNPPEDFSILLSQDPALYDGKYTLIFETKDKESGINYYEVKEPGMDWKRAESPYVTIHQPPSGTIFVKAIDYAGNSTMEEITSNIPAKEIPLASKLFAIIFILTLIALISTFIIFIKRKMSRVI